MELAVQVIERNREAAAADRRGAIIPIRRWPLMPITH
jgi:hypothetical protein